MSKNYFNVLDGIINTTKYDTSDALKNAFHMNDLRFAITPWIKKTREGPHCRCPELQYISQISRQNKNVIITLIVNTEESISF